MKSAGDQRCHLAAGVCVAPQLHPLPSHQSVCADQHNMQLVHAARERARLVMIVASAAVCARGNLGAVVAVLFLMFVHTTCAHLHAPRKRDSDLLSQSVRENERSRW